MCLLYGIRQRVDPFLEMVQSSLSGGTQVTEGAMRTYVLGVYNATCEERGAEYDIYIWTLPEFVPRSFLEFHVP